MASSGAKVEVKIWVDGAGKAREDLVQVDDKLRILGEHAKATGAAFRQLSDVANEGQNWQQKIIANFKQADVAMNMASNDMKKLAVRMQEVARGDAFRQLRDSCKLTASETARLAYEAGNTKVAMSLLGEAVQSVAMKVSIAGTAFGFLATNLINTATELDRVNKSYIAVMGTAEDASKELGFISNMAQKLGVDFINTAASARFFFAAARNSPTLAKDMRRIFESFTEAGTALSLTGEQMHLAFLALGQMISKGKVQAEELRGQLGEHIPGAFQMAAKAMGMTASELDKFMASGKLVAEDLLPKLARVVHETFGDAAVVASEGLQANLNRLSTAWLEFKNSLVSTDVAVSTLKGLRTLFESLASGIWLVRDNADALLNILKGGALTAAVLALGKFNAEIKLLAGGLLGGLISKLTTLGNVLLTPWGKAAAAVGTLVAAVSTLTDHMDGLRQAQNGVNESQREAQQINKALADLNTMTDRELENFSHQLETGFKHAVENLQTLKREMLKPVDWGMNWSDYWRDLTSQVDASEEHVQKFYQELTVLQRTAADTNDFRALSADLVKLQREAEESGNLTDHLRDCIERAQQMAALGIQIEARLDGYEATRAQMQDLIHLHKEMMKGPVPQSEADYLKEQEVNAGKIRKLYNQTPEGRKEAKWAQIHDLENLRENFDSRNKLDPQVKATTLQQLDITLNDFYRQVAKNEDRTDKAEGALRARRAMPTSSLYDGSEPLPSKKKAKAKAGGRKATARRTKTEKSDIIQLADYTPVTAKLAQQNAQWSDLTIGASLLQTVEKNSTYLAKLQAKSLQQGEAYVKEFEQQEQRKVKATQNVGQVSLKAAQALQEYNAKILSLSGDSESIKQAGILKELASQEQAFQKAGLTVEQYKDKLEYLAQVLQNQYEQEQFNARGEFYQSLAEITGDYSQALEYENHLIDEQAKKWLAAKVPAQDVALKVASMREDLSTDPFVGAGRGLKKFAAQYNNEAKNWEKTATSFAESFEQTFHSVYDQFLEEGKWTLDSFVDLFKSMLKQIAYQALVQPVIISAVNGVGNLLSGGGSTAQAQTQQGSASSAGNFAQLAGGAAQSYVAGKLVSGIGSSIGSSVSASINSAMGNMFPSTFAVSDAAAKSALHSSYFPSQTFTQSIARAATPWTMGGAMVGGIGASYLSPQLWGNSEGVNWGTTIGSTLGGALGSYAIMNAWNPSGWVAGAGAAASALLGGLAGGGIGSLFGGGGDEPGLWMAANMDLTQRKSGKEMESLYNHTKHGYDSYNRRMGQGYFVQSRNRDGMSWEAAQKTADYLEQVIQEELAVVTEMETQIEQLGSSVKKSWDEALSRHSRAKADRDFEGEDPDIEAVGKALIHSAQEQLFNALTEVDLTGIGKAADGFASNTTQEVMKSITKAVSFVNLGQYLGEFQDEFEATIGQSLLEALNAMDTSSLQLHIDKSSLEGWGIAAQAVEAKQEIDAAIDGLLHPLSDVSQALQTTGAQFDTYKATLKSLGWYGKNLTEIEQKRMEALRQTGDAIVKDLVQPVSSAVSSLKNNVQQLLDLQSGVVDAGGRLAYQIELGQNIKTYLDKIAHDFASGVTADNTAMLTELQEQTTALQDMAQSLRDEAKTLRKLGDEQSLDQANLKNQQAHQLDLAYTETLRASAQALADSLQPETQSAFLQNLQTVSDNLSATADLLRQNAENYTKKGAEKYTPTGQNLLQEADDLVKAQRTYIDHTSQDFIDGLLAPIDSGVSTLIQNAQELDALYVYLRNSGSLVAETARQASHTYLQSGINDFLAQYETEVSETGTALRTAKKEFDQFEDALEAVGFGSYAQQLRDGFNRYLAQEINDFVQQGLPEFQRTMRTTTQTFADMRQALEECGASSAQIGEVLQEQIRQVTKQVRDMVQATEQDLNARVMALQYGESSAMYQFYTLGQQYANELQDIADKFGADSQIYQRAQSIQTAEILAKAIEGAQEELEQALTKERQTLQNALTALLETASSVLSEAESLRNTFSRLVTSLKQARMNLWTGNQNINGPSVEVAYSAFNEAYGKAMAGDTDAASTLESLGDTLLNAGLAQFADRLDYTRTFRDVDQKLKMVGIVAKASETALDESIVIAQLQVDLLNEIVDALNNNGETSTRSSEEIQAEIDELSGLLDDKLSKLGLATYNLSAGLGLVETGVNDVYNNVGVGNNLSEASNNNFMSRVTEINNLLDAGNSLTSVGNTTLDTVNSSVGAVDNSVNSGLNNTQGAINQLQIVTGSGLADNYDRLGTTNSSLWGMDQRNVSAVWGAAGNVREELKGSFYNNSERMRGSLDTVNSSVKSVNSSVGTVNSSVTSGLNNTQGKISNLQTATSTGLNNNYTRLGTTNTSLWNMDQRNVSAVWGATGNVREELKGSFYSNSDRIRQSILGSYSYFQGTNNALTSGFTANKNSILGLNDPLNNIYKRSGTTNTALWDMDQRNVSAVWGAAGNVREELKGSFYTNSDKVNKSVGAVNTSMGSHSSALNKTLSTINTTIGVTETGQIKALHTTIDGTTTAVGSVYQRLGYVQQGLTNALSDVGNVMLGNLQAGAAQTGWLSNIYDAILLLGQQLKMWTTSASFENKKDVGTVSAADYSKYTSSVTQATNNGDGTFTINYYSTTAQGGADVLNGEKTFEGVLASTQTVSTATAEAMGIDTSQTGSFIAGVSIAKYANGGITPADEIFLVGENGPELMTSPHQYGVLNNVATRALMGEEEEEQMTNSTIITYLRAVVDLLRQTVMSQNKTYSSQKRMEALYDKWDKDGLPATAV